MRVTELISEKIKVIIMMNKTRYYSLDILKIVATIFIVFSHYQQTYNVKYPSGANYYFGNFYFGSMVELFFILSGYFMVSYSNKIMEGMSFDTFIIKRVIRLLPIVAIAALGFEIIVTYGTIHNSEFLSAWGHYPTLWGWIINSLGIQAGWGLTNLMVNNPTWYVCILILCYVVFYIITYIARKLDANPLWGYLGMIFLGMAATTYQLDLPFLSSTEGSARGYIAFGAGVVLGMFCRKYLKKADGRVNVCLQVVSVTMIALWVWLYFKHYHVLEDGFGYLLVFWLFPALIVFMQNPIFERVFNFKFIGTISKITFDVYAWHVVCIVTIAVLNEQGILSLDFSKRETMYFVTAIAIVVGIISYFFLEIPITNRLANIENKLCNKEEI